MPLLQVRLCYAFSVVHSAGLSDEDFFAAVQTSGARALLIGRRAMILLGAPVMTADYDLWVHIDDIEKLNAAFDGLDHAPNCSAVDARRRGRYVIENGERVDVLVARSQSTRGDAERLTFDDAWSRRKEFAVGAASVSIPSIDDLITTKRWAMRAKDVADIQWLELIRGKS